MGNLQRFGVLDKNAVTGRHPGAGHDCRRRCQPQSAGAGDHQHGHGVDQCGFQRGAGEQPASKGGKRDQQYRGHKYRADPVDQFLDRRLGGLGVFHQADDACQHTLGTERGHFDQQLALAVDGPAGHCIAGCLGHWQALATDQCFVCLTLPLRHTAVGREAFAGANPQQVADAQGLYRDIFVTLRRDAQGPLRAQGLQGADGLAGAALAAAFQVFAQQH